MNFSKNPYIFVRRSRIHNRGVFAKCTIRKGTRIVEYVGEKITKAESDIRAEHVLSRAAKDRNYGAVYIFELNSRYDIDGNVPYNIARFINHSCDPNCETESDGKHIWIKSVRNIKKGEEITYNYGYDFDGYYDHECRCGSHNCVGYILAEEFWPQLKRVQKNAKALPQRNR